MSGFIVKAITPGGEELKTMALRKGFDELIADIADKFQFIPASVTLFSRHNGTQLWVHLGAQGDLDVVLAEAAEWGSHVINVEVTGVSASRGLDAVGCLAGTGATASQLLYLWWMVTEGANVGFFRQLEVCMILALAMIIHLGTFFFLLDDETSHNHPFRQWVRPPSKRIAMLLLAPFSGDVMPLVGCGACGFDAPLRSATRDSIVKGGIWIMLLQDGLMLSVLQAVHFGDAATAQPLSAVPEAALYLTLGSLAVNLPRRIAHFLVGSCEAAYREKEELAEDAQVSKFANEKMAARAAPLETPHGCSTAAAVSPSRSPAASKGNSAIAAAASKRPAASKGSGKAMM